MVCSLCNEDRDGCCEVLVQDGLARWYCEPCAITVGVFCEKHKRAHQFFVDDTHVCLECVEERATSPEVYSEVLDCLHYLRHELPEDQYHRLGDNLTDEDELVERALRRIVCHAMRHGMDEFGLCQDLIVMQSVDIIISPPVSVSL